MGVAKGPPVFAAGRSMNGPHTRQGLERLFPQATNPQGIGPCGLGPSSVGYAWAGWVGWAGLGYRVGKEVLAGGHDLPGEGVTPSDPEMNRGVTGWEGRERKPRDSALVCCARSLLGWGGGGWRL